MKLTTREWTDVQSVLQETKAKESWLLVAHIENRTFGKVWSQQVAIGLRGSDEEMVKEAIDFLAKEREEAPDATD